MSFPRRVKPCVILFFSPFSQTRIRRTTELPGFATLSPVTRDSNLFLFVCKTRSIGAGGNGFLAGQLLVPQKFPLTWATKVRPFGYLKVLSRSLTCAYQIPSQLPL